MLSTNIFFYMITILLFYRDNDGKVEIMLIFTRVKFGKYLKIFKTYIDR